MRDKGRRTQVKMHCSWQKPLDLMSLGHLSKSCLQSLASLSLELLSAHTQELGPEHPPVQCCTSALLIFRRMAFLTFSTVRCVSSWADVPLRSTGLNIHGVCSWASTCMIILSWVSVPNTVSLNYMTASSFNRTKPKNPGLKAVLASK